MNGERLDPIELTRKLISFPTVSRDSNLELIHFVQNYLDGWGVASRLFLNPEKTKANLFATIGPEDEAGVILSGHTDVVPVDGQNWSADPFTPWIKDERLYGRGSADMKGFLGTVLSFVPEMVRRSLNLPIHLALSFDEEVGCTGVLSMIEYISAMKIRPGICIVGEPTSMKVVDSHKGLKTHRTRVCGRSAHSSAPELGANAIMAAARLIGFIETLSERAIREGPVDNRFMPPYTTFNVGQISGGNAVNIIAENAEFDWEFRPVPGFDSKRVLEDFKEFARGKVLEGLRRTAPEASIDTEELTNVPPLVRPMDEAAETLIKRLARANATGTVSYATEAGHFQTTAEIPTYVCGPGDIAQAHKPDEYISLKELSACSAFVQRLLDYASGN